MRLQGSGQLNAEQMALLTETIEDFYRTVYQRPMANARRSLEDVSLSNFDTNVTITGQSWNNLGNTIMYNQSVSFVSNSTDVVEESQVRERLMEPLSRGDQSQTFLELLQDRHPDFQNITGIESDTRLKLSSAMKDSSNGLFALIVSAIMVSTLICC